MGFNGEISKSSVKGGQTPSDLDQDVDPFLKLRTESVHILYLLQQTDRK